VRAAKIALHKSQTSPKRVPNGIPSGWGARAQRRRQPVKFTWPETAGAGVAAAGVVVLVVALAGAVVAVGPAVVVGPA
jgi:hypothetical protein